MTGDSAQRGGYVRDMPSRLPSILYHYTTPDALLGILEKNSIRATSVSFLNDTSEIRHAIAIARELWGGAEGKFRRHYGTICDIATTVGLATVYVACFSSKRDDLSQWRAYARPGGICLGFSRRALERSLPVGGSEITLLTKCVYKEKTMKWLLSELRKEIDANLDSFGQGDDRLLSEAVELSSLSSLCKSVMFASEDEVRLVFQSFGITVRGKDDVGKMPHLGFHVKNGVIVPHFELSLFAGKKAPWLCEVIVGPTPDREAAVYAIGLLMERYGIDPEVSASTIPFRDW
jgi:Protein of unknown function (DUF2971)